MGKHFIIAVDFDGTLCEDKFPFIGNPKIETINILNSFKKKYGDGLILILWTCRVGERLEEAVEWSKQHGISFDLINENYPPDVEFYGSDCRKIHADIYIDDKSCDCLWGLATKIAILERKTRKCLN